jgi:hypothetical protein
MIACWLDDERVRSQEGDFYGGWITDDIAGPFQRRTRNLGPVTSLREHVRNVGHGGRS